MKILAKRRNGDYHLVVLVPPVTTREHGEMSVLRSACGMEHYFCEDGIYDGWGINLPEGADVEDAFRRAKLINEDLNREDEK